MKSSTIIIKEIKFITHDVLHLICSKPEGLKFTPGQATKLAIDKNGIRNEKGAFTYTSLPSDTNLEFIIKTYPSHDGLTDNMMDLKKGDILLMGEPYGYMHYKESGLFIAAGSGITPFISILKA